MSNLLHVIPLISLHELTPITDAHQWNAHDHLEYAIRNIRNIRNLYKMKSIAMFQNFIAKNGEGGNVMIQKPHLTFHRNTEWMKMPATPHYLTLSKMKIKIISTDRISKHLTDIFLVLSN